MRLTGNRLITVVFYGCFALGVVSVWLAVFVLQHLLGPSSTALEPRVAAATAFVLAFGGSFLAWSRWMASRLKQDDG